MTTRIGDATREAIRKAWPDILLALATGALVKPTLDKHGLSRMQVHAMMLEVPAMRAEWESAREQSADALYEQALECALEDHHKDLAQHVRTRIDTLKWAARIRNPRLYGDKAQLDVNVKTVDLTAIIVAAQQRLAAAQRPRELDVTPSNREADAANVRALPAEAGELW